MQRLAAGLPLVALGFDPAPVLAGVTDDIGWRGEFLTDPERSVYRRLGLRRAPWWRVWSPRTVLFYARADRRAPPSVPSDVRQMGGDAVVRDGHVVACWRPRTPVDRVDPAVLLARGQIEIM